MKEIGAFWDFQKYTFMMSYQRWLLKIHLYSHLRYTYVVKTFRLDVDLHSRDLTLDVDLHFETLVFFAILIIFSCFH